MFTAPTVWRRKLRVKYRGIFFCNLSVDDRDCNSAMWLSKCSVYYEYAYKQINACDALEESWEGLLLPCKNVSEPTGASQTLLSVSATQSLFGTNSFVCISCLGNKVPRQKGLEPPCSLVKKKYAVGRPSGIKQGNCRDTHSFEGSCNPFCWLLMAAVEIEDCD